MELSKLKENIFKIFDCESLEKFKDNLKQSVLKNDFKFHSEFSKMINNDLEKDYLQMIFQYYFADRKNKMQDYTPKSLAKLCAELSETKEEKTCLDLCSGSGALTIQKWNTNKNLKFICKEFDENVIPFLLFNLQLRNIDAVVFHTDVLSDEIFKIYTLKKQENFSFVEEIEKDLFFSKNKLTIESCVSNPPYNMKWEIPFFANIQERFSGYTLPPKTNANFSFILTAINEVEDKAVLILPNGVLTSSGTESKIREELVNKNLIDAIISCPESMFEATSIPTCIMVLNKNKKTSQITMIDARSEFIVEEREQRGQFGGDSHTGRTYTKKINVFSDENIKTFINIISGAEEKDFSKKVTLEDVKNQDFVLTPSRYLEIKIENEHRSFQEIIDDLNRVTIQKNTCKLTLNETIARNLGFDNFLYKTKVDFKELNKITDKLSDRKLIDDNYISLTKNKNEIKFENNNKEEISGILLLILNSWKSHIHHLNNEQNRFLAELRDAILPKLMSGEIKL